MKNFVRLVKWLFNPNAPCPCGCQAGEALSAEVVQRLKGQFLGIERWLQPGDALPAEPLPFVTREEFQAFMDHELDDRIWVHIREYNRLLKQAKEDRINEMLAGYAKKREAEKNEPAPDVTIAGQSSTSSQ